MLKFIKKLIIRIFIFFEKINYFNIEIKYPLKIKYRKHLLWPQGHKPRTWVMPQGLISVITCRIYLKLGGNVSSDVADKMHFDS